MAERFTNRTPFAATALLLNDAEGAVTLTWIVKATFDIADDALTLADPQTDVRLIDEYDGEPGQSTLRYPSDAAVRKEAADVLLCGHACPPKPPASSCDVELQVGELRRRVRVFGDRVWVRQRKQLVPGEPEPFERMPLTYTHALGGPDPTSGEGDERQIDPRNPLGLGYRRPAPAADEEQAGRGRASERLAALEGCPLPNIEDPDELIRTPEDQPAPAGFGPIPAHWQPRLGLAGTHDEQWREERFPLAPTDLDPRFFNVAPPELQVPGFLRGGEQVSLLGGSARGPLRFTVPQLELVAGVVLGGSEPEQHPMVLDTMRIDGDRERVELVWRAARRIHGRTHELERLDVTLLGEPPDLVTPPREERHER